MNYNICMAILLLSVTSTILLPLPWQLTSIDLAGNLQSRVKCIVKLLFNLVFDVYKNFWNLALSEWDFWYLETFFACHQYMTND